MNYTVHFIDDAEAEFLRLPRSLPIRFKNLLPYLEHNPLVSYPFLPVKPVGPIPGVWRFPLRPYRVFYKVDRQTVWAGKFWKRPPAYHKAQLRQLGRPSAYEVQSNRGKGQTSDP